MGQRTGSASGPWRGDHRIAYIAPVAGPAARPSALDPQCLRTCWPSGLRLGAHLGAQPGRAATRSSALRLHRPRAPPPAAPPPRPTARSTRRRPAPTPAGAAAARPRRRAGGRPPGVQPVLALRPGRPRRRPRRPRRRRGSGWRRRRRTVVGYAVTGRAGPISYLQRLAVHPDDQRHGMAHHARPRRAALGPRRGASSMLVNTQERNRPALALYEHLGFVLEPDGLDVLERTLPDAGDRSMSRASGRRRPRRPGRRRRGGWARSLVCGRVVADWSSSPSPRRRRGAGARAGRRPTAPDAPLHSPPRPAGSAHRHVPRQTRTPTAAARAPSSWPGSTGAVTSPHRARAHRPGRVARLASLQPVQVPVPLDAGPGRRRGSPRPQLPDRAPAGSPPPYGFEIGTRGRLPARARPSLDARGRGDRAALHPPRPPARGHRATDRTAAHRRPRRAGRRAGRPPARRFDRPSTPTRQASLERADRPR